MAIFRQSALFSAISGAIGGVVAKTTKGSGVLAQRTPPLRKLSPSLQASRNNFVRAHRDWEALTVLERDAWNTYASIRPRVNRLGVARLITGMQLFIGLRQIWYLQFASGLPTTPPTDILSGFSTLSLALTDGGPYNLTWTPHVPSLSTFVFVYGSIWYTDRPRNFFRDYVFLGARTDFVAQPFDIFFFWTGRLPEVRVGMTIGVRVFRFGFTGFPTGTITVTATL